MKRVNEDEREAKKKRVDNFAKSVAREIVEIMDNISEDIPSKADILRQARKHKEYLKHVKTLQRKLLEYSSHLLVIEMSFESIPAAHALKHDLEKKGYVVELEYNTATTLAGKVVYTKGAKLRTKVPEF